jgi:hypothetical protein
MKFPWKVLASVLILLGGLGILIAIANLYNIDPQPWWFLAS